MNTIARVSVVSILVFFSYTASARDVHVCPQQINNSLISIDIFDGKPEDMAGLAPEPKNQNNGVWGSLGKIYQQGSTVYVACGYEDGLSLNVQVKNRVRSCSSTDVKGLDIICQTAPKDSTSE